MKPVPTTEQIRRQIKRTIERGLEGLWRARKKPAEDRDDDTADGKPGDAPVFHNSLILACLSNLERADTDIQRQGRRTLRNLKREYADLLLTERSATWSWNYLRRRPAQRYPDDLDDTVCALLALESSGSLEISPEIMGRVAGHLMTAEKQPGGPYRTWIIPSGQNARWNDVDTAVNANIAYFLGRIGVFLDNLDAFVRRDIDTLGFTSLYYHSKPPVLYFIARYLAIKSERCGPIDQCKKIVMWAQNILVASAADMPSALDTAFLILALIVLGQKGAVPVEAIHHLIDEQDESGLWPACPMYIEEIEDGRATYSGSAALTAAFCLEALSRCAGDRGAEQDKKPENNDGDERADETFYAIMASLDTFSAELAKPLRIGLATMRERFARNRSDRSIALFPFAFQKSLQIGAPNGSHKVLESAVTLGTATSLGWIGYTIQDDIADEGTLRGLLPLSNACLRESLRLFEVAAPDEACRMYIRRAFIGMDTANAAELAKIVTNEPTNRHRDEPSSDLLAQKSFGHALGPLVMLMRADYAPDSPEFKATEEMFKHYLIARQMSDDAHDWEDDLRRGVRNSAAALLPRDLDIRRDAERLREIFWTKTIDDVARRIVYHAARANASAAKLATILDPAYIEKLTSPLERSASRALSERDRSMRFLSSLQSQTVREPTLRSNTATAPAERRASG